MLIPVVLIIALAGTASSASDSSRIVGGSRTTIERHPSLVQVDFFRSFTQAWSQSCAANILNILYVLSAAHCFEGRNYDPSLRRIRAGSSFRNIGGVIIYVKKEFNHPSYGQNGFDGDISVVLLTSPLVYNPAVQRGIIIDQSAYVADLMPVVHAGWGLTKQGGLPSPELHDVVVYTINRELCRQRYLSLDHPVIVTDNMICAGLLDIGGRGACQGDSGGPLYFGNIIVGIISWSYRCANGTFPGVNTAISSYTNWIRATAV